MKAHILGFPRIGANRELKKALEAYWAGKSDRQTLEKAGAELRARHWALQHAAGLDFVSVGDFAFYDQVLATSALLGAIPSRFGDEAQEVDIDLQFRMARGFTYQGKEVAALEMTKWFDTNYHYLVPELNKNQTFCLASDQLFREITEAKALGYNVKATLIGPLTWLWLSKTYGEEFDKLTLIEQLLPVYAQILDRLAAEKVEWVQIDEPILALDLASDWQAAFEHVYNRLQRKDINILLATYFAPLQENLWTATHLPVAGLHIDAVRGGDEWRRVIDQLPAYKVLSLGVIDGRNIWRADLQQKTDVIKEAYGYLGDRLWVSSSCSLLHSPVDLSNEQALSPEIRSWLSFAVQKLDEVAVLKKVVGQPNDEKLVSAIKGATLAIKARQQSAITKNEAVRQAVSQITEKDAHRKAPFSVRYAQQNKALNLPHLPTTTIGSFPQTAEIRQVRALLKTGKITQDKYEKAIQAEIALAIKEQEALGLDVLVHGEAERNDMVEYFGELLSGFIFTQNGWVQSYGSRCVKPPVIVGDVSRPKAMTVSWTQYAQSLTQKPVKGMLTGPVTILGWSFVRDDLPRDQIALQIALAIRDEVLDLEKAGISIIQIDEPAFREGLPLRKQAQAAYWDWAVKAFRVSSSAVQDETQIHTHMCYSEFNDSIAPIIAMDADVITIETARSAMELLRAFEAKNYPNAIGPGVYDIHSPNVPSAGAIASLLQAASRLIPEDRLWINPDCGLKTRAWPETKAALSTMVRAAELKRSGQDIALFSPASDQATHGLHKAHRHGECCTVAAD